MSIREFLNTNPSFDEVLQYVEREAQRIVSERRSQSSNSSNSKVAGGE